MMCSYCKTHLIEETETVKEVKRTNVVGKKHTTTKITRNTGYLYCDMCGAIYKDIGRQNLNRGC